MDIIITMEIALNVMCLVLLVQSLMSTNAPAALILNSSKTVCVLMIVDHNFMARIMFAKPVMLVALLAMILQFKAVFLAKIHSYIKTNAY